MHKPIGLFFAALLSGAANGQVFVTEDESEEPRIEKMKVAFAEPMRLRAGEAYVHTETPGWAAPCWFDVDGDGQKDLIVGQFAGGKMLLCRGQEDGSFAAQEWLQAEGEVAEVPGVW